MPRWLLSVMDCTYCDMKWVPHDDRTSAQGMNNKAEAHHHLHNAHVWYSMPTQRRRGRSTVAICAVHKSPLQQYLEGPEEAGDGHLHCNEQLGTAVRDRKYVLVQEKSH